MEVAYSSETLVFTWKSEDFDDGGTVFLWNTDIIYMYKDPEDGDSIFLRNAGIHLQFLRR